MQSYYEVKQLVSILTSKRELSDEHGERVALLASQLAVVREVSPEVVKMIGTGAHLHDIGKLVLRGELLNLNRKLSEAERSEMEQHTVLGWEIVEEAGYDPIIKDIVRFHHERLDGKGYPDGLKDSEIPLGPRIVSICDAYEALTSKRSYREAYSHNFAMAFIQKDKGTRFDPKLVDLFFEKVALS